MQTFFLRYFLIIFFLLAKASYAQTASVDLANLLNAVHTMKANFVQTIYDNHGKAIQQSTGNMSLERPGKFRWQVKKPIPQLIIANNSRLWVYDPDLQQVTIRVLSQSTGETPALLLSHVNVTLDKDYIVKPLTKNTPNSRWFELLPRGADNVFASVQLGFVNNQIREMYLKDHLGHTTRIQFEDAKSNMSISPSTFIFKAPANVDVIDETRKK